MNKGLPRMTKLKVVVPIVIGTDSIQHLMEYFKQKSIVVAPNTGEMCMCKTIADFAIGLMLSCSSRHPVRY